VRDEVRDWVAEVAVRCKPQPPVLEVGSYNVNGTIRDLLPQDGYIGLDKKDGPGVDIVSDILDRNNAGLHGRFNTVACVETLEHVVNPWEAMRHLHSFLAPGGLLIVAWCFNFPIHHEEDYWRATPDGLHLLIAQQGFEQIKVETEGEGPRGVFATARKAT